MTWLLTLRRLAGAGLALVCVVQLALTAPAQAAFPGRDGLLAVQPVDGTGIVLVSATGHGARRICTAAALCGEPQDPSFSADGRAIVFSGPGIRLVGLDGSCLDCQLPSGSHPALLPGGTMLTFVSGGGIAQYGIDGLRRTTVLNGGNGAVDDVWSSTGKLAIALGGHIWIGKPKGLQSLGPGSAPSWSPRGTLLAVVRRGWVVVVDALGHFVRRLVPGAAPAFSPDGRWVAFIGPGHRLEVIPSAGGTPQPVGHVRGVTVDWQPIPAHRPRPCLAPPGSKVLARSPQAIVTADIGADPGGGASSAQAALGCLFADGRERLLQSFSSANPGSATSVTVAGVGGQYAAVVSRTVGPQSAQTSELTSVFDLRTGQPSGHGGEADACQSASQLCPTIDQVVVGSDGVSAVHVNAGPAPPADGSDPLAALACASDSLCIASDSFGQVDASTNPGASPWNVSAGASLTAASCPSASFCAATGGSSIYTSTNPAGGSWSAAQLAGSPSLGAISCPSTNLCVASANPGDLVESTNPGGGPAAWSVEHVDGNNQLEAIACPSRSECVASDLAGNIVTSTDPSGGSGTWTVAQVSTPQAPITSISCPSTSLCFATAPGDTPTSATASLFYSTSPTSGQWTKTTLPTGSSALACPSSSLCVAVAPGTISTSTAPATGAWNSYAVTGAGNQLDTISCPSTTLCVATGDDAGHALVSTNPAQGAGAWTPVLADPISCPPLNACGTEEVVAADRNGLRTLDTSTEFEPQTGAQLTGLALTGDTLTWQRSGSPQSAALQP